MSRRGQARAVGAAAEQELLAGCGAVHALGAGALARRAAVVLLAGGTARIRGERRHGAASWTRASVLAPGRAHGQYQGVHNMSIRLGGLRAATGSEVAG